MCISTRPISWPICCCVIDRSRRPDTCSIAAGRLTDLLRRVSVFGVTLARIDIRQDAARHTDALSTITSALGLGCYGDWDEPRRIEFLLRELEGRRPLIPANLDTTPAVRDVLDTFAMIARMPPAR